MRERWGFVRCLRGMPDADRLHGGHDADVLMPNGRHDGHANVRRRREYVRRVRPVQHRGSLRRWIVQRKRDVLVMLDGLRRVRGSLRRWDVQRD